MRAHPRPGSIGVVFVAAAQQPADAEQRVAGVPAMPQRLLLDPAADPVERVESEATTWKASSTRVALGRVVRSAVA